LLEALIDCIRRIGVGRARLPRSIATLFAIAAVGFLFYLSPMFFWRRVAHRPLRPRLRKASKP
jgi:hypothetical protein